MDQPPENVTVELDDPEDSGSYVSFADEEKRVRTVLKEVGGHGDKVVYKVRFCDNHTEEVRRVCVLVPSCPRRMKFSSWPFARQLLVKICSAWPPLFIGDSRGRVTPSSESMETQLLPLTATFQILQQ